MSYYTNYLFNLFTGLFDFFDRIFIQTGYIVWVGSAFLMFITYRFLVVPVFGSFNISNLSDTAKQYQKKQAIADARLRSQLRKNNISKRS